MPQTVQRVSPAMISTIGGANSSNAPTTHSAITPSTKRRRPNSATAPADPGHDRATDQIGDKQSAEQRRRKAVGRRRQMEVHIGERRDEIEQYAEANGIGRDKPPVAQMLQHLQGGHCKPAGAAEIPLTGQG